jgi:hypothetical protein
MPMLTEMYRQPGHDPVILSSLLLHSSQSLTEAICSGSAAHGERRPPTSAISCSDGPTHIRSYTPSRGGSGEGHGASRGLSVGGGWGQVTDLDQADHTQTNPYPVLASTQYYL